MINNIIDLSKKNILIIIVFIALSLRLVNLNQSFWLDEAAQVIESGRTFTEQFNLAADFHPPLYHLFLHFWMKLGQGEIWIRLLSVFFSIGSIIVVYKIGETLGKKKEGIMAALLLSLSPYHIWYSQEARPYMLFVLVSLLSTYYLIKMNWRLYTIFMILSLYSLYFAPFLIFGHLIYLFLFNKKDLFHFAKAMIISTLVFLPWLPNFIIQLKTGTNGFFSGWTDIVSVSLLRAVPSVFAKFIFGHGTISNKLIYSIFILPMLSIFLLGVKKEWDKKNLKLTILFFIPLISALEVSIFIPIVAPQRLIFLLPLFLILVSCGIYSLYGKAKILAITTVIIISVSGIIQYYFDPSTQREQWRQAVSFTQSSPNPEKFVLFIFPEPFAPYLWYGKNNRQAIGIAPKFQITDDDLEVLTWRLYDKKSIYLFDYLSGLTDPDGRTKRFLIKLGYKQTSIKDFPGVGFIYIYDK